jgi:hypothetical protein
MIAGREFDARAKRIRLSHRMRAALRLVLVEGQPWRTAAKANRVSLSGMSRARLKLLGQCSAVCPTCGQMIPNGIQEAGAEVDS